MGLFIQYDACIMYDLNCVVYAFPARCDEYKQHSSHDKNRNRDLCLVMITPDAEASADANAQT
jgi:hypothetical protein